MEIKNTQFALMVICILVAVVPPIHAGKNRNEPPAVALPSAEKGDPPPGGAMALSVPQARARLKETLKQVFVGQTKCHVPMMGSTDVAAAAPLSEGLFGTSTFDAVERDKTKVHVDFKTAQEYLAEFHPLCYSCGGARCYAVHPPSKGHPNPSFDFLWVDEATAQEFVDAFNRLIYAVHQNEDISGFTSFTAAAKAWRETPVKPPLSPETDRHRILAENALKEKNMDSAIEHYQSALEIQPTWPAGWFNVALLYAEQKSYADATDSMKHYLELTPDAPDAQQAREQMIIWEDKAKSGRQ